MSTGFNKSIFSFIKNTSIIHLINEGRCTIRSLVCNEKMVINQQKKVRFAYGTNQLDQQRSRYWVGNAL